MHIEGNKRYFGGEATSEKGERGKKWIDQQVVSKQKVEESLFSVVV